MMYLNGEKRSLGDAYLAASHSLLEETTTHLTVKIIRVGCEVRSALRKDINQPVLEKPLRPSVTSFSLNEAGY